jgi:hypothetical protein
VSVCDHLFIIWNGIEVASPTYWHDLALSVRVASARAHLSLCTVHISQSNSDWEVRMRIIKNKTIACLEKPCTHVRAHNEFDTFDFSLRKHDPDMLLL